MKNKLLQENNNTIHCYKQGIFWTAYEQSACQVWKMKMYKANSRYIKYLNQTVVSVSFPDTALDKIVRHFESEGCRVERKNNYIRIDLKETLFLQDFMHWKAKTGNPDLKKQIMSFSLETKTPLDAFEFIRNIQIDLKNNIVVMY